MLRLWSSRAGSRIEQKDVAALETMLGDRQLYGGLSERPRPAFEPAFDQYRA